MPARSSSLRFARHVSRRAARKCRERRPWQGLMHWPQLSYSNHYGSPLRLAGCRNDAQDMATIFRGIQGFAAPTVLLDSQAT